MTYTLPLPKDFETVAELVKALPFLDVDAVCLIPLQGEVKEYLLTLLIWNYPKWHNFIRDDVTWKYFRYVFPYR